MSALTISSQPEAKGAIARQWIGAHLLAQVICLVTASIGYGGAKLLGIATPDSPKSYLSVAFALALVTELIFVVASAWLRGAVLRQVLPRFQMVPWLIVVGGYLLAMALLSGFSTKVPIDGARAAADLTADALVKGLMVSTVLGAIFGLLVGSLEALVIRRSAEGAGLWVLMTMVAWSAALSFLVVSSLLLVKLDPMSATMSMATGFALKFASALLIGLLTLPALLAMTPRLIQPEPVA